MSTNRNFHPFQKGNFNYDTTKIANFKVDFVSVFLGKIHQPSYQPSALPIQVSLAADPSDSCLSLPQMALQSDTN
jgi:hypothetical protein